MNEETVNTDEDLERLKFEFFNIMQKLQKVKPHTVDPCDEVTQSEANALHAIGLYEQKCGVCSARPGLIATHMNITPSALSQVLRSLEEKNLVSRSRENRDCRAVVLSLTPEGQHVFNNINARWEPRMLALIQFVGIDNLLSMTETINSIIDYDEELHEGNIDLSDDSALLSDTSVDQSDAKRERSGKTCI